MMKKLSKVVMSLLISFSLNASDEVVKTQVETKIPSPDTTSLANREGKKFAVTASVGSVFERSTVGFEVGYYLNPSEVLSASYLFDKDAEAEKNTYKGYNNFFSVARVNYKKFLGNSFYLSPSLFYKIEKEQTSYIYTDSVRNSSVSDTGVGFVIGNQWQFDNFTIGCDWIGLNQSLFKMGTVQERDDIGVKNLTLNALNFYFI
jgi:hypothetical protein